MKNKKILITGCRGGFGKAAAIKLTKRGHTVYATTHTEEQAKELKDECRKLKLPLHIFKLDVTNVSDHKKIDKFKIDVLINNAGAGESGSLAEISIERVRNNFETNLFGPLQLSQRALQTMIKHDNGRVIFISSLAGRITMPFLGVYCMTKFSISSGAEALRRELSRKSKNIFVSLVEPGAYHTGFNERVREKKYKWMRQNSYFKALIKKLKREDRFLHTFIEKKSLASIVNKIIQAVEDPKPRLRYTAPFSQSLGVRILRIFGK